MDWANIGLLVFSVFKVLMILVFMMGLIWLIHRNLKLTNFNLWIKYKLFGKNISEDLIKEIYETEDTAEEFTKKRILSGKIPSSKIKEMLYIFNIIKKEETKNGNK